MSTTFGTLSTTHNLTPKRNRHSVENDQQTALIKRINRLYAKRNCNRKVRVVKGHPQVFIPSNGDPRPDFFGTLDNLWKILNQLTRGTHGKTDRTTGDHCGRQSTCGYSAGGSKQSAGEHDQSAGDAN